MNGTKRPSTVPAPWSPFLVSALIVALLLGVFIRLSPVLSADFPLHDGGLFYTMAQELQEAHYRLPTYTAYNHADIPLAYPPLPFYILVLVADLSGWALLDLLRILPAVVSVLTLPAFFLLCKSLLSKFQAVLAVFAFALLPRTFIRLIMGGGLTRSVGLLFALLALHQAYVLYTRQQRRALLLTTLFASLTILSHPEMAWFTAYSAGLLFLFYGRNRPGVWHSALVILGTLLLTAPWWGGIIARYGPTPFLSASRTGLNSWYAWLVLLLLFEFTGESFIGLLAVLGLLGVFSCVARRRWLLPVWLVATLILDRRGEATRVTVLLAMLVGVALDQIVLPALQRLKRGGPTDEPLGGVAQLEGAAPKVMLIFFLLHALFSAWAAAQPGWSDFSQLSAEERTAMQWVAENLTEGSRFLVVTGNAWSKDATAEWFPALAGRQSLTTVQGSEWLPDRQFALRLELHAELQRCAVQGVDCLEEWRERYGADFSHVFVSKQAVSAENPQECCLSLRAALEDSTDYFLLYDGPGAAVFSRALDE